MYKYLIFFLLAFGFYTNAANLKGWKKLYSKSGLSFYSKKIKGSDLLNFRAIGEIKIKAQEALAILRNVEIASKWDENTIEKKTIKNISDIEAITYSQTSIPWPFQNRDLVLTNKLHVDKKRYALRVDVNSVAHKDYPKRKKLVRANLNVKMFLRPKNDDESFVDIQILVDPKGSIPHWVVNIVQKSMPYDFLKGLERYARKVEVMPNPGVQALYNELLELLEKPNIPVF